MALTQGSIEPDRPNIKKENPTFVGFFVCEIISRLIQHQEWFHS